MARQSAAMKAFIEPDPMDEVVRDDDARDAEGVAQVLDDLRAIITEETKLLLYRKPMKGGQWAYIDTLAAPINPDTLLDEIKSEYGGGEYQLRIHAKGKVAKIKRVVVEGKPKVPGEKDENKGDDLREFLPLLLNMSQQSGDKTMQMMTMMMGQMQQSSQQQTQMLVTMMTTLIPVMVGGKVDPVQLATAIASAGGNNKNSLADMIATITAVKELVANNGDGGGGGEESMFQTVIKTLGPTLADMATRAPAATAPASAPALPSPQARPNPSPQPRSSTPPLNGAPQRAIMPPPGPPRPPGAPLAPPPQQRPPFMSDPVLSLIGEDVLFFARRKYPPALAAEAILSRLDEAEVPEEAIIALVVRFNASPDWLADLARAGIDLRPVKPWADEFLDELVGQYAAGSGAAGNPGRGGGGEDDASPDAGFEP
jgi:hypothetical protein